VPAKRKRQTMRRLMHRQGGRCYYCNDPISSEKNMRHPQRATIDHRVPRSLGGTNERINLVAACNACNGRKGDMTATQFIAICFEQGPVAQSVEQRIFNPTVEGSSPSRSTT
jgi:CRISPR/Cas system Type II protein with McrA/HNH and RuvC-like nuclease domain